MASTALRDLLGEIHDYGIDLEDDGKRAEFVAVLEEWDAADREVRA